ncbi:MAG: cell division protein FtsX, partial [Chitinophagales bacterium]
MNKVNRNVNKAAKPSYLYAIISVSLVLFMLGLLGVFLTYAQALSSHFKENIEVTVILADQSKEKELLRFNQYLESRDYIKTSKYVSKADAAQQFVENYEEDFVEVLGYNPLFSAYYLYLHSDFANMDSLNIIKADLKEQPIVQEIFYQESLVNLINSNVQKVGLVFAFLSIFFMIIAIALIDNTIKLNMYSNRFLVKSMQLVGATQMFIARPFLIKSLYNGVLSGLLASLLLLLTLVLTQQSISDLRLLNNPTYFVFICIGITFVGVLISWWSTRTAVYKYLQMRFDDLY